MFKALESIIRGESCFWCDVELTSRTRTKEHVIPRWYKTLTNDEGLDNIRIACSRCNNDRAKIHNLLMGAAELRLENIKGCRRLFNRKVEIETLRTKWIKIEKSKLGWSFTESLEFANLPILQNHRQYDFDGCKWKGVLPS